MRVCNNMAWIQNIKVANKILALIIIATMFLSDVGYTGYYYLTKLEQQGNEMYRENLISVRVLNDMRAHIRATEAIMYAGILTNDSAQDKQMIADFTDRVQKANKDMKIM